jgi:fructokinase
MKGEVMRVLSFGEILFDVIEGVPYLGGAPLNFAGHLARLGAESYIFSAVGQDALGKEALKQVESLGVNVSLVERHPHYPTGTVAVELNKGQPNYTILKNVAYDFLRFPERKEAFGKAPFDMLYFGTLVQRNKESRETLRLLLGQIPFGEIFYDVNLRKDGYTEEIIRQSLDLCTILKLNDEEVKVLGIMLFGKALPMKAFAQQLVEAVKVKLIIITAGGAGAYVYEKGRLHFVPGQPVEVVDTVGAGDAFSAAFIYQYQKSGDAIASAKMANALGGYVAASRGPLPEYSAAIKNMLRLA